MSAGRKSETTGNANSRREDRAFACLPGDRDFRPEKGRGLALMVERLAVAADESSFM